jgi:hypothetical protein
MHSTRTFQPLQQTDPHDTFVIDPASELLNDLSRRRARTVSGVSAGTSTPAVDTTFRAAVADDIKARGDRSATRKWGKRVFGGLLLVLGCVAAAAWEQDGDMARQVISSWMPPLMRASSTPASTLPAQPDASSVEAAATDQPPAQPAPAQPSPAAESAQGAAPTVATTSADSKQVLPSMAHDLAAMGQQIEQLKASIEELKAGQAQMSRDIAKTSEIKTSEIKASETKTPEVKTPEQNPRPRISALPRRPVAAPPRYPRPAFSPAQAAVAPPLPPPQYAAPPALSQPAPPPQVTVGPDGETVVRPPMPLR